MTGIEDLARIDQSAVPFDVFDLEWAGGRAPSGLLRLEFDRTVASTRVAVVLTPADGPVVALVADDLALPSSRFELRGPGVWIDLVCETPLDHWTVGLEAFGVTVDGQESIAPDSRGEVVAMGLDLDLDTVGDGPRREADGLRLPLRVHGEILIGADAHDLDCSGTRWRGGAGVPADSGLSSIRHRLRWA